MDFHLRACPYSYAAWPRPADSHAGPGRHADGNPANADADGGPTDAYRYANSGTANANADTHTHTAATVGLGSAKFHSVRCR